MVARALPGSAHADGQTAAARARQFRSGHGDRRGHPLLLRPPVSANGTRGSDCRRHAARQLSGGTGRSKPALGQTQDHHPPAPHRSDAWPRERQCPVIGKLMQKTDNPSRLAMSRPTVGSSRAGFLAHLEARARFPRACGGRRSARGLSGLLFLQCRAVEEQLTSALWRASVASPCNAA